MNEDKLGPFGKVTLLGLAVAFGAFLFFRLQQRPPGEAVRTADVLQFPEPPISDIRLSQQNAQVGKGGQKKVASTITLRSPNTSATSFLYSFEDGNGVEIPHRQVASRSTPFGSSVVLEIVSGYSERPPKPVMVVRSSHTAQVLARMPIQDLPAPITILGAGKVDPALECTMQTSTGQSTLMVHFKEPASATTQYRVTLLATPHASFEGSAFLNAAYSEPGTVPQVILDSQTLGDAKSVKLKIETIQITKPFVDSAKFAKLVLGEVGRRLDIRQTDKAPVHSDRGDKVAFSSSQAAQRVSPNTGQAYFAIEWEQPNRAMTWDLADRVEIASPKPENLGIKGIKFEYFQAMPTPNSSYGNAFGRPASFVVPAPRDPVVEPPYCKQPGPTKFGPLPTFVVRRVARTFRVVASRIETVPVEHVADKLAKPEGRDSVKTVK